VTPALRVHRITFFVKDLEAATTYYRDALGLPVAEIREGWAAFRAAPHVEIALHRGTGRYPRIELSVRGNLEEARASLNARGARLGPSKTVRGRRVCASKDRDGNSIQLSSAASA
jgi:catechol 2,3-dioxygenase-like lactoylglutathione lyase family enzyme